jgi:DMSO/TMAO reductase YedYZ heme-binding membrane subunit
VATTRSRPRGRESARPSSGGVAAEHATKIYSIAGGAIVVIVAFLALTGIGHVIDAATQHFMLFYAGVFALIALCASVGLGLVATDRMVLNPGHRIFVQSAHRAASFGALAFLIIHIVTEILAQRSHVLDAFVPFLSPFRTFYIGLGTIASDLILLLVITSILRKRFTAHGKAWRWRAIHYAAYVAFVLGVWHGLLGGRPGKPYVDWSYGFVVAFVALGLAVRILANSLRPKENLSGPAVPDSTTSSSAPMRAASMFAQLGAVRAAASASAAVSAPVMAQGMLSAPVGGWDTGPSTGPLPAMAALPATATLPADDRQPFYEPGYVGPPRYVGAPRNTGSGPMPQASTGPMPRVTTGPQPWTATGQQPRPSLPALPRAATGPQPRATTGPLPQLGQPAQTGNMPQSGGRPAPGRNTGPMPRAATGPMPRAATGPMPRAATGPMPRAATGPQPRAATGPQPRAATGPQPRAATGPAPRPATGPLPRAATGPMPQAPTGPAPRAATGPQPRPRAASGPMPRAATGPMPSAGNRRAPVNGTGPAPVNGTGPMPRTAAGPASRSGTGPQRRQGAPVPPDGRGGRRGAQAGGRNARGPAQSAPAANPTVWGGEPELATGAVTWNYGMPPWDGGAPEPDPSFRYREPGPGMPGYRGPRDPYRGGDGPR